MLVKLTAEDIVQAATVMALQMARKAASGRGADHGGVSVRSFKQRFGDGLSGFLGEIAVSRLMNLAWTPGGKLVTRGDVGRLIEVRTTEHRNGHLLIYEVDEDDSIFYMVVGSYPTMDVVGWVRAGDVKLDKYKRESDPPCYWVPQSELNDAGPQVRA